MEDPLWLRLLIIGLVIAALVVGYLLFTGKFASNTIKNGSPVSTATPVASVSAAPSPSILGQNTQRTISPTSIPTPVSAYDRISARTQNGTQSLPRTGFPVGAVAMLSIAALISGWGLRKFPH